jgi:hypothetical protein
LREKVHLIHSGGPKALDLTEIGDIHPADQPAQAHHDILGLGVEIPKSCRTTLEQTFHGAIAELDGVTGEKQEVGLERVGQVAHDKAGHRTSAAPPTYDVDQAAVVSERARRANDRGFRLVISSRPEHRDAHGRIIARSIR